MKIEALIGTAEDERNNNTEVQLELFPTTNLFALTILEESFGDNYYKDVPKGSMVHLVELKKDKYPITKDKEGHYYYSYKDKDGDTIRTYDVFNVVCSVSLDTIFRLGQENPDKSMIEVLELKYMQGKMGI